MTDTSVLISGAASGIGRVIAEAFLADGAAVHICDASAEAIAEFAAANPPPTWVFPGLIELLAAWHPG